MTFRRRVDESTNGELSKRLAGALTALICVAGATLATVGLVAYEAHDAIVITLPENRAPSLEFVADIFGELSILIGLAMGVLLLASIMMIARGLKGGWDRRATITVVTCLFLSLPVLGAIGFTANQLSQLRGAYQVHVIEYEPPPLEEWEDTPTESTNHD